MHRLRLLFLAGLAVVPTYTQVVTGQSPHRVSSGYVFYAPTASESSYLLGNDGAIAHSWPGSGPAGLAVKLLPDGSILRSTTSYSARFFAGRGVGGKVEKWTWDGKLEWSYVLPDSERYMQHHDVEALPNGNVLILAWEWKSAEAARSAPESTPTGFAEKLWHLAASRGWRDARNIPIRSWTSYLAASVTFAREAENRRRRPVPSPACGSKRVSMDAGMLPEVLHAPVLEF